MDKTIASFDGAGYDPFLCAQDLPESFAFDTAVVLGDEASLLVHTSFENHAFKVRLEQVNGRWVMSDVVCAVSDSDEQESLVVSGQTEGWQAFQDEEYGLQVQYPPDWTIQEARIDVTASDSPIRRVLGFRPVDWEDRTAPVSMEVGVGSLEEMRMWPVTDAEHRSSTEIGGYRVLVAEGMCGEVFYVFEHPSDGELWIALRDSIGSQADNELQEVVDAMLSSFRFIQ
jgi:hypothetical protein